MSSKAFTNDEILVIVGLLMTLDKVALIDACRMSEDAKLYNGGMMRYILPHVVRMRILSTLTVC